MYELLILCKGCGAHSGTLTHGWVKNLFTDTQGFGSYLQQFIGINEFKCLFQTQYLGRCEPESFVSTGGTGIGKLLLFADVAFNVFPLSVLPDYHTGVNLFTRTNKEDTALLRIIKTVGDGFACFKGNQ